MKISTKINLLTTAMMLCILVFINLVVFFLFMETTVNLEENALTQKTGDIFQLIHKDPSLVRADQLSMYLTNHSYIRILKPNNKVVMEVTNDHTLASAFMGEYSSAATSERSKMDTANGEEQVLIVRIPIQKGSQTLEFGERLTGLEMRKDLLKWILAGCTLLGAFLSLLGGRWLSNRIMKPISTMSQTMEEIEQSGVPKTIILANDTKDELHTLAKTFNRMIIKLNNNLEKQKQFVSDASHELKTPLTVIKSYTNLLRRHGLEKKDLANEAVLAIQTEVTRIQKMIETMLDMATLEKEVTLELSEVNLVSLCERIIKKLSDTYHRNIRLSVNEPVTIQADELKFRQVLIILLDNAIKYSQRPIDVSIEKEETQVILRIKDYGIGIPKNELESIFERFYRVDKARSRDTGGFGLGLHIAKTIMALHKGKIRITSTEEKGTEVTLIFPIS